MVPESGPKTWGKREVKGVRKNTHRDKDIHRIRKKRDRTKTLKTEREKEKKKKYRYTKHPNQGR